MKAFSDFSHGRKDEEDKECTGATALEDLMGHLLRAGWPKSTRIIRGTGEEEKG